MSSAGEKPRLGWLPVFTAGVVCAGFAALTFNGRAWTWFHEFWPWTIRPMYHDWHVVRAGWFAAMSGLDPLADPANPFNYPRFVLGAAHLGATAVPAEWAGLGLAAVFLASALMWLGLRTRVPPLAAAAALVSPPVLLLNDRGNLDAVAFIAIVVAWVSLQGRPQGNLRVALAACALLFAAMLKLYPVVTLLIAAAFWPDRRRVWFLALFGAWLVWAAAAAPEIALVMQKTTRGLEPAYGYALPASRWYFDAVAAGRPVEAAHASMVMALRISAAVFVAGSLAAVIAGMRCAPRVVRSDDSTVSSIGFVSGAAMYVGTFMLGTNWAYRLVFLLLCWPLLWERVRGPARASWAIAALVGTLVVMFAPFHLPMAGFVVVQMVCWVTAWVLVFGIGAVIRERFRARNIAVPIAAETR